MPRIVVLDGYTLSPGDLSLAELERLGELLVFERTPRELVLERARDADVLVTNKTVIDAATIDALPALRGIAVLATGVNVVDVAAARARGIPVSNVPSYSTASVAEHTLALLFELTRHVGLHAGLVRDGAWSKNPDFSFWREPLVELDGLVLGIVGLGEIGSRVARLGAALGMRVVATASRRRPTPPEGVLTVSLARVFAESDVVTLHCPLTKETEGLVNAERLRSMKPSALLLNTSRGALVDEPALADALARGVIAGAALDVLSVEPPPADHPLLHAPRCIVTPHQAWTSRAARERLLRVTVENVAGLLARRPLNVVHG
jgi:glycerate dehydrogenase